MIGVLFYLGLLALIGSLLVIALAPWIEDRAEAAEAEALTRNHRSKK